MLIVGLDRKQQTAPLWISPKNIITYTGQLLVACKLHILYNVGTLNLLALALVQWDIANINNHSTHNTKPIGPQHVHYTQKHSPFSYHIRTVDRLFNIQMKNCMYRQH